MTFCDRFLLHDLGAASEMRFIVLWNCVIGHSPFVVRRDLSIFLSQDGDVANERVIRIALEYSSMKLCEWVPCHEKDARRFPFHEESLASLFSLLWWSVMQV
jgi:hypothetical protein